MTKSRRVKIPEKIEKGRKPRGRGPRGKRPRGRRPREMKK